MSTPATPFADGAVFEYLAKQYGGLFQPEDAIVSVGTAVTQLAAPNAERTWISFCNFGTTDVVIGPNQAITASRGLRLGAGGSIISLATFEDGILPSLGWFGISAVGGQSVYILQTWRYLSFANYPGGK